MTAFMNDKDVRRCLDGTLYLLLAWLLLALWATVALSQTAGILRRELQFARAQEQAQEQQLSVVLGVVVEAPDGWRVAGVQTTPTLASGTCLP